VRSALPAALLNLLVFAPVRAAPVVEAEPSHLTLGPKTRAEITVRDASPSLHGAASVGTLSPSGSGEGFTRYVWTPPADARAPLLALFAFWIGDAPTLSDITVLALPCAGRTELSIDTEPSAKVTVEVAGARFGPRKADVQGHLRIPVEVPPNAHEARVLAELSDQSKIRVLPLTLPPSPWLLATAPARSAGGAPVKVLLVVPDTEESAGTELIAEGARLEREQEAPRRLLTRVTPDASRASVELTARTLDGSVRAQRTLEVARPEPAAEAVGAGGVPAPAGWIVGGSAGGYVGGGSNAGSAFSLVLGRGLSPLPLVAEVELGLRNQTLAAPVPGLGVQSSSLLVFPLELALRWQAVASGIFRLGVRGGGGMLLCSHHLSSNFDADFSELAVGWEVFAAVQAGLQAGPVEPYLEIRGAISRVTTDHLDARPGGGVFSLGIRGVFQ